MVLSELQALSTADKLHYLSSTDGLTQLQEYLTAGLSLFKIAQTLGIHDSTLYKYCDRDPAIVALTGRPLVTVQDIRREPAYRLLYATSNYNFRCYHDKIIEEYSTPEELWYSDFIINYFKSFNKNADDFYDDYLKRLSSAGLYRLSHLYNIAYCYVNRRGVIKILTQAPQGSLPD
jgi:hypothetical protein